MDRLKQATGVRAAAGSTRLLRGTLVDAPSFSTAPAPAPQRAHHPAALATGSVLARRYRILACIGRGGMATVYRARQLSLGREVAIKVLHQAPSEVGLARFYAEASLTAQIRHANVVDILDLDLTAEGTPFIVMELLHGEDLYVRMRREGPLPWPTLRRLLLQISAGLAAAHRAGVVHRDLKPANCFCVYDDYDGEGESLKLLDFGVARTTSQPNVERITIEAQVVGTPEYMSPEQVRGEAVDARSDVYALGVILAELLTGKLPFDAGSPQATLAAQIYEPPPSLEQLAGPEVMRGPGFSAITEIYTRALAKDPADRYPSISEMAEAIAAVDNTRARAAMAPTSELGLIARITARSRGVVATLAASLLSLSA